MQIVSPVEEIASRLELGDADLAVVRRRLRFVDGQPYNTNDSYFPRDLVRGSEIERPGDIARGANRVLEELGHGQVRVVDDIMARMPNQSEARAPPAGARDTGRGVHQGRLRQRRHARARGGVGASRRQALDPLRARSPLGAARLGVIPAMGRGSFCRAGH
ncbi:UTRA domain-containing protein [Nonomuraea dietziae]|uniref:UTRA domain-containing protein n=1 Tax=Nonomuraea dietziae TaxID=65515 RepID=UPI0031E2CAA1